MVSVTWHLFNAAKTSDEAMQQIARTYFHYIRNNKPEKLGIDPIDKLEYYYTNVDFCFGNSEMVIKYARDFDNRDPAVKENYKYVVHISKIADYFDKEV